MRFLKSYWEWAPLSLVLTAAFILIMFTWQPWAKAETTKPNPVYVDVILVKVAGSLSVREVEGIAEHLAKDHAPYRVIVYPDGYTPVLIPEDKVEQVKKNVGDAYFLRLSPKLE